jgi:hypothetical protein
MSPKCQADQKLAGRECITSKMLQEALGEREYEKQASVANANPSLARSFLAPTSQQTAKENGCQPTLIWKNCPCN